MFRKRRKPTPFFQLLPPYEPITGQRAELMVHGFYPYCAMMQVAVEDTHNDYVICRGFDIRINSFIDSDPGIPVAKPYWNRRPYVYTVGQIFPAFLPFQTPNSNPADVPWRVGQNPGVAAISEGHPANLSETVNTLQDENSKYINYMLIDGGPSPPTLIELCLAEDHPGKGLVFDAYQGLWDPSANDWSYPNCGSVVKAIDHRHDAPYPDAGATGLFTPRQSDTWGTIYECVSLDCTSAGPCVCNTASSTPSHTPSST